MQRHGRKNRPFYRIVAIDGRQPRDGRYLEELGSYDTSVRDVDARVRLKPSRIKYWLSVGAQTSEKVQILLNKYLKQWEEKESAASAPPASEPAGTA
jgi:small subunit ribosomal protein S16